MANNHKPARRKLPISIYEQLKLAKSATGEEIVAACLSHPPNCEMFFDAADHVHWYEGLSDMFNSVDQDLVVEAIAWVYAWAWPLTYGFPAVREVNRGAMFPPNWLEQGKPVFESYVQHILVRILPHSSDQSREVLTQFLSKAFVNGVYPEHLISESDGYVRVLRLAFRYERCA